MKKSIILLCFLMLTLPGFAIPFTLQNNGFSSIYLEIPGVMNPNLSPLSRSGVDLREGQEIFFFHKGEKYLLLKVSEELAGQRINVRKYIKDKKREIMD